jgi:Domain of unknown function (DUF222)
MPLEEIEQEICELSAHMAVGMCRWLQLVAEFDERRGWAEWGVYSCAHWLSWRCSFGLRAAHDHVRVARALKDLPLTTEAFAAGELSYSKVRAMTRAATPDNEETLLMYARHATGAQLEKIVSGYSRALRATSEGANEAHERRYLYTRHEADGSLVIEARVPAEDGALLLAALAQAERGADAKRPRRWLPVPRLHPPPVSARASHHALGAGWPYESRQPGPTLQSSPPARTRRRLQGRARRTAGASIPAPRRPLHP